MGLLCIASQLALVTISSLNAHPLASFHGCLSRVACVLTRRAELGSEVDSCYEGVSGKVVFVDEVKPEQSITIDNLKVRGKAVGSCHRVTRAGRRPSPPEAEQACLPDSIGTVECLMQAVASCCMGLVCTGFSG